MTMRYQQLREGQRVLESVALYLFGGRFPQSKNDLDIVILLRTASNLIKEELKHPERFNLDGTKRILPVREPRERRTVDGVTK